MEPNLPPLQSVIIAQILSLRQKTKQKKTSSTVRFGIKTNRWVVLVWMWRSKPECVDILHVTTDETPPPMWATQGRFGFWILMLFFQSINLMQSVWNMLRDASLHPSRIRFVTLWLFFEAPVNVLHLLFFSHTTCSFLFSPIQSPFNDLIQFTSRSVVFFLVPKGCFPRSVLRFPHSGPFFPLSCILFRRHDQFCYDFSGSSGFVRYLRFIFIPPFRFLSLFFSHTCARMKSKLLLSMRPKTTNSPKRHILQSLEKVKLFFFAASKLA